MTRETVFGETFDRLATSVIVALRTLEILRPAARSLRFNTARPLIVPDLARFIGIVVRIANSSRLLDCRPRTRRPLAQARTVALEAVVEDVEVAGHRDREKHGLEIEMILQVGEQVRQDRSARDAHDQDRRAFLGETA